MALIIKLKLLLFLPLQVGGRQQFSCRCSMPLRSTGIPLAARLKSRRQSVYRHPGGLEDILPSTTTGNTPKFANVRLRLPHHRHNHSDRSGVRTCEHRAYTGDTHVPCEAM